MMAMAGLTPEMREALRAAWAEGEKAGSTYERAKWHWQGRNLAALLAMGLPAKRPDRPLNPYTEAPRVLARCTRCGERLADHGSHVPGMFRCADGVDTPWEAFTPAEDLPKPGERVKAGTAIGHVNEEPVDRSIPEVAHVLREREQCSPPQPGDTVWRGNVEGYIGSDWQWHEAPHGTPTARLRDRLADALFCTECLCLRIDPRHWARKGMHS